MSEDKQRQISACINAMKSHNYPINLDSLIFGEIVDGQVGEWSYFDELSHKMAGKWQGDDLTNKDIMDTLNSFMEYVKMMGADK